MVVFTKYATALTPVFEYSSGGVVARGTGDATAGVAAGTAQVQARNRRRVLSCLRVRPGRRQFRGAIYPCGSPMIQRGSESIFYRVLSAWCAAMASTCLG